MTSRNGLRSDPVDGQRKGRCLWTLCRKGKQMMESLMSVSIWKEREREGKESDKEEMLASVAVNWRRCEPLWRWEIFKDRRIPDRGCGLGQ